MEMTLNNGFCEMTDNEMLEVDGGGVVAGIALFVGGVLVGYLVDGGVKYLTGKTCGDWVAEGLKAVFG